MTLNIGFQPYLQAILSTERDSRDWQDYYMPTRIQIPLYVQPYSSSQDDSKPLPKKSSSKKAQQEALDVLVELQKHADKHVVLVGKPGSGKSTTLKRLLLEKAQQDISHPSVIPVLIRLRYFQRSVEEQIQSAFSQEGLTLSRAKVEQLLNEKKLFLLFDGLNELPSDPARNTVAAFRQTRSQTPMVFTTRDLEIGGDLGISTKLKMMPLTDVQVREFVQKRLPVYADALLRQIKGHLRQLADTPLLLGMICKVFGSRQDVPKNRGELFKWITKEYDDHKYSRDSKGSISSPGSLDTWQAELLQYLAFRILEETKPLAQLVVIPERKADSGQNLSAEAILEEYLDGKVDLPAQKAKDWLAFLRNYHLIQRTADNKNIEFHHHLFQDYYAAKYLLRHLPKEDDVLQCHYLNYLKWTEPIALMMSFLDKPQAERLVKLALEVDLALGARLAGEVKAELQDDTVCLVNDQPVFNLLKIDLLKKTHSPNAIPYLRNFLNHKDKKIRDGTVDALGKIGASLTEPEIHLVLSELYRALKDPEESIRINAIYRLGELGNKAATSKLIDALNNENLDIWDSIISNLGTLRDATAVPKLLIILSNQNPKIRKEAIRALEEIGHQDSDSALALSQALEDEDAEVRKAAARAIEKLGFEDDNTVLALSRALEDENSEVREAVAKALVKIGNEASIPYLLKALGRTDGEDKGLRNYLAQALGRIGAGILDPELREQMLEDVYEASEDAKDSFWRHMTFALAEIDSESIFDVSGLLGSGCGKSMEDRAISMLKNLNIKAEVQRILENQKKQTRPRGYGRIARKLAYLCAIDKEAFFGVREVLERRSSKEKIDSMLEILRGFREVAHLDLDQNELIPILHEALKDKSVPVRRKAASTLAALNIKSPSPELVEALIKAVEDEDKDVRALSIETLGKIGSSVAVPKLIEALDDPERWVKWEAIEALGEIGDARAVSKLIDCLQIEDDHVPWTTIKALKEIGNEASVLGLVKALKVPKSSDRRYAINALHELCVMRENSHLLQAIKNESVISQLLEAIKNEEDISVFEAATYLLEKIGGSSVVQALTDILIRHVNPSFRRQAAGAIGAIGDKSAKPYLLKALKDEETQISAAVALGQLLGNEAIPILREEMQPGKSSRFYRGICEALGAIDTEDAFSVIFSWLDSKDFVSQEDESEILYELRQLCTGVNASRLAERLINQLLNSDGMAFCYENYSFSYLCKRGLAAEILLSSKLRDILFDISDDHPSTLDFERLFNELHKLQNRCQYYNYEVFQKAQFVKLEPLKKTESSRNIYTQIYFENGTHTHNHEGEEI
jgi:HEAT repeat protein